MLEKARVERKWSQLLRKRFKMKEGQGRDKSIENVRNKVMVANSNVKYTLNNELYMGPTSVYCTV